MAGLVSSITYTPLLGNESRISPSSFQIWVAIASALSCCRDQFTIIKWTANEKLQNSNNLKLHVRRDWIQIFSYSKFYNFIFCKVYCKRSSVECFCTVFWTSQYANFPRYKFCVVHHCTFCHMDHKEKPSAKSYFYSIAYIQPRALPLVRNNSFAFPEGWLAKLTVQEVNNIIEGIHSDKMLSYISQTDGTSSPQSPQPSSKSEAGTAAEERIV